MLPKSPRARRCARIAGHLAIALPLLVLSGCPEDTSAASPAKAPAAATAPALRVASSGASSSVGVSGATPQTQNNGQAVKQLIINADAAYESGLTHYRAGQMDAARADFDRSVDMMLTSPLDVRATPALSDEFDKIIEGINTLEMATLQQGAGVTQQVEISPAEAANDVTFPVDPNLRARAEADLKTTQSDLPLVINDPVASFISYFTNNRDGRAHLARSLERAGRYREMIQRILREEGVPQDLIYQAVAESGFQPQAMNGHSGAGGMWQFMPATGALYGLTRNAYVDDRFDPEKATRAYAKYMHDVYNQLGDWYLVMAGYDWGPGAVQHAVSKTGYADFWQLYRRNNLPAETKNYVPIILAATIIAKNQAQYGFSDIKPLPPLTYDIVTTQSNVSLRLVADLTGAQLDEIVEINPALLRLSTPPSQSYDLHIPPGTAELFNTRLAQIPQEHRESWRFHTVATGETLTDIAHTYHSEPAQIASINGITGDALEEGQGLIIPVAAAEGGFGSTRAMVTHYTTHKGDTVVSVADRFGVSAAQLRTWNHLSGNSLTAGRKLQVASPSFNRAAKRSSHKHAAAHGKAAAGGHAKSSSSKSGSTKSGSTKTGSTKKGNHTGSGKASKPAKKKTS